MKVLIISVNYIIYFVMASLEILFCREHVFVRKVLDTYTIF
jgi:hypothetical protein